MSAARAAIAAAFVLAAASQGAAQDVLLFRHATAPGVGDPPNFKLGDCGTQRNLDEAGRAEARRMGDLVRARHLKVGAVRASQWCRTRETAQLAFPEAAVQDAPAFNSFFSQEPLEGEMQTQKARDAMRAWKGPGALVVVTHQVNIAALSGVNPVSGEGVLMRRQKDGSFKVVGRIRP